MKMKKTLLLALCAAVCLAACAGEKNRVTVKGDLGGDKTVYLHALVTGQQLAAGSATPDGAVILETPAGEPVVASVGRGKNGRDALHPVILDGEPVEITLKGGRAELTAGSSQNMALAEGVRRVREAGDKAEAVRKEYQELRGKLGGDIPQDKMSELEARFEAAAGQMADAARQAVKENAGTLVPVYFLDSDIEGLGTDFVAEFLETYKYKDHPQLERVRMAVAGDRNKMPGAKVAELTMSDPEGKETRLTDYVGRGKYVLVDFWASWCGPCRGEMPNVKACYEKYRAKGFEVVGVSFDSDRAAWRKGIADLGITWPQMSDLKGWKCAASDIYNVKSIPETVLFGPDGTVVRSGLRGEELEATLKELLDK